MRDVVCELVPLVLMPVSLHKLLIHGAQVMETLCIPVGQASVEDIEVKHKHIQFHRLHHTRKTSRAYCTEELMNYLLVSSNPVFVSHTRKHCKKQMSVPRDVLSLLEPFDGYVYDIVDDDNDSYDDGDVGEDDG